MKKTFKRTLAILLSALLACSVGTMAVNAGAAYTLDAKRFLYGPPTANNNTAPITVEWGPDLFAAPATASSWNPKLLVTASVLANNAYFQRFGNETPWYYTPGAGDINTTLGKLGFGDIVCDRPAGEGGHYNYVTFAHQTMTVGGAGYQLVAVMLRGTVDADEWASDFLFDGGNYATGFYCAEQAVLASLKAYLAAYGSALPKKLLITGHSRGAAIANLLAADLNRPEHKVAEQENIYAYTFASPNVAKESFIKSQGANQNIWNFVNPLDIVPQIPFVNNWGYGKFGETVTLPADSRLEAEYKKYSGFSQYKVYEGNTGVVLQGAVKGLAAAISLDYYITKLYPWLEPKIKQLFEFEMGARTKLEQLDANLANFFTEFLNAPELTPALKAALQNLEATLLKTFVYSHTPEIYVAQARVLAKPHIVRTDSPKNAGVVRYRGRAAYEFEGAGGTVNWKTDTNIPGNITFETKDNKINIASLRKTGKLGEMTFTLTASDVYGNADELKVNVRIEWWQWLIIIFLFGWIWY